ncbi:MAG: site-2 protease family protein [Treponema sp.]|jgi:regulator of sigma E protease|nr:site-2 protease family protein [Treponema sp.]
MILIKILLGLIGLGVVVFVHELGHFIAARRSGIDVEAFSIGWGRPVLKRRIGTVEYRLGLFPIGGYCKMRGDNEFREAWENNRNQVEQVKGSFFSVNPWKRIAVAFSGPFFNFLFAILVFSVVWGIGFDVETLENRVVLLSDIDGGSYPSDAAGLQSGDRIIEINGKKIANYRDIQEHIASNPQKSLNLTADRDGTQVHLTVVPKLDSTGAGKIGVYHWTDPVIQAVKPGGAADRAGLREGDRITTLNGSPLPYTAALLSIFKDVQPQEIALEYERGGQKIKAELDGLAYTSSMPDLGVEFKTVKFRTPALSPFRALVKGCEEASKTLALSVKSLGLLFNKEIDLSQAVSGPARITYMVGDIAAEGFGRSVETGFSSAASFLALISIALCIMNLLPLPILDGGLILLFFIELIKRKPLNPKFVSAFQTLGVILIFGLMAFALFNDIRFFAGR